MDKEDEVRASFAEQSYWCGKLGSPFTARLCALIGERLDARTDVGRRVLGWPGDPRPIADALALRLCGGLHWLVRSGRAPDLARLYPPGPSPDAEELWCEVETALAGERLDRWLDSAPQTNEVGRAAVLMSGLLVVADRFGLPLHLYELGASAGLNLLLDRYGHDLGGVRAGNPSSPLQLKPEWTGPPPPRAAVEIAGRHGVDLNPADPVADRDRLIAYVWPDQDRRLGQIERALAIAARDPPPVEAADAAGWLERALPIAPARGLARVVMHSVAYQYFPPETQRRVATHVHAAGADARADAPLAWLRFEKLADDPSYSLRLRTWPGEDRLLAWVQPHGAKLRWLAGD